MTATAGSAILSKAPERFVLQLATAAEPGALQAWLSDAADGARVIYASGIDLPREAAGVVLVTRWIAEGLVRPFRQRDPHDARRWQFLAERITQNPHGAALRVTQARAVPSAPSPPATRETGRTSRYHRGDHCVTTAAEQQEALLHLLRGRAATGGVCPTFAETRDVLGLARGRKGAARARYLFDRLTEQRRIAVSWGGPGKGRVVTILAKGRGCGMSTAEPQQ